MTKQFDPKARYDVIYEGARIGELVKGVFYEGRKAWENGEVRGDQFFIGDDFAGRIEGLAIVRDDGTVFELIPQQPA